MDEVNNLTESTVHESCSIQEPYPGPLLAEPRSIPKLSIKEASKLELMPLPVNLKYVYLSAIETVSFIIAVDLTTS